MILILLESAFCALFNGTLDKVTAYSQQKLQAEWCKNNFYRHVRSLHIINRHIRNTKFQFSNKVYGLPVTLA